MIIGAAANYAAASFYVGNIMKAELVEQIKTETDGWEYKDGLPEDLHGFKLRHIDAENGDSYELFAYENESCHRSALAYFHEETREYKFKIRIGLTEFCLMQYITDKLEVFEGYLRHYLEQSIHDLGQYNPETLSYIMREQNITVWDYKPHLPPVLEGFELFITPDRPVRVLNGSYIIFDYSDFALESNFIIYYNEFRSEFYGEARIKNIPEMNYTFDSDSLLELEERLREHLVERLREIRERSR